MTMSEWWAEYDLHAAPSEEKLAGNLTQGDVDEILDFLDERAQIDDEKAASQDRC